MKYESPISLVDEIVQKHNDFIDQCIMSAVENINIKVDKDELIKALRYDRNQYEKGYADGQADAVVHAHWTNVNDFSRMYVGECSRCRDTVWIYKDVDRRFKYCPSCGAKMDIEESEEDDHAEVH